LAENHMPYKLLVKQYKQFYIFWTIPAISCLMEEE